METRAQFSIRFILEGKEYAARYLPAAPAVGDHVVLNDDKIYRATEKVWRYEIEVRGHPDVISADLHIELSS
jgi:hypothetical protein